MRVKHKDLSAVSAYIGNLMNMVQGPGGNTSLKLGNTLYVKASGTRLNEAMERDIFCQIDLVSGEVLTPSLRPSIELGLHREIDMPVVLHVHSIGSLSWALRIRTKSDNDFLGQLGLHLAPYLRPGDEITNYVRELTDFHLFKGILLQNHGLITWGNSSRDALINLLTIEAQLHVESIQIVSPGEKTHALENIPGGVALTPDHAVFIENEATDLNSIHKDVCWAIDQALNLIPERFKISTIPTEETEFLRNWEAEKYRRNMN